MTYNNGMAVSPRKQPSFVRGFWGEVAVRKRILEKEF
jgi:hypothetical protein